MAITVTKPSFNFNLVSSQVRITLISPQGGRLTGILEARLKGNLYDASNPSNHYRAKVKFCKKVLSKKFL